MEDAESRYANAGNILSLLSLTTWEIVHPVNPWIDIQTIPETTGRVIAGGLHLQSNNRTWAQCRMLFS